MNKEYLYHQQLFMESALNTQGKFIDLAGIKQWLDEQKKRSITRVIPRSIHDIPGWYYDNLTGSIRHNTGKFFSIDGINVCTNWDEYKEWQQPIINQAEIGILGIITKEFEGVLHFLLQAKIEPGNINFVQLSPTLQATFSNYTQVHKGNSPYYLNYFLYAKEKEILFDQLQSEQGSRFLRKRNRNIIIKIDENVELHNQFIWLTLGQIKALIEEDNIVNMDTRSVLSCVNYSDKTINYINNTNDTKAFLTESESRHSLVTIMSFLTHLKSTHYLEIKNVPLKSLSGWSFNDMAIGFYKEQYFKVIAVDVLIENREVINWSQPMIEPVRQGICAFIIKEISGIFHFAVQAKLECGNHDMVEFAPTVQYFPEYHEQNVLPFLDYVLFAKKELIIFDTLQSEEGGRFFQEQNRNMIVLADESISEKLPPHYIWVTFPQLQFLLQFNNYINIQARSLLSAVSFI